MTRKDYILIADAIKEVYKNTDYDKRTVDAVIYRLSSALSGDNNLFDRDKFRSHIESIKN